MKNQSVDECQPLPNTQMSSFSSQPGSHRLSLLDTLSACLVVWPSSLMDQIFRRQAPSLPSGFAGYDKNVTILARNLHQHVTLSAWPFQDCLCKQYNGLGSKSASFTATFCLQNICRSCWLHRKHSSFSNP